MVTAADGADSVHPYLQAFAPGEAWACTGQFLNEAARALGERDDEVRRLKVQGLVQRPEGAEPIGLQCPGPVQAIDDEPLLVPSGWARRQPLDALASVGAWSQASILFP